MLNKTTVPAIAMITLLTACSGEPARLGDGTPSLKTAETALASGSPEIAYRICGALVDAGDQSTKTLVCKGNALTGMGRTAEAAAVFAVALQGAPRHPDALIGTGRLRLSSDPAGAERLFMQALSSTPRNAVALNNLGISRDLQGRHSDAQTAYSEAIAADPDSRPPQVNLALSMAMSGRAREATRILRPLAENGNASPRERHDYAAVLTMAGRPDEAAQFLSPELSAPQAKEAVSGFRSFPAQPDSAVEAVAPVRAVSIAPVPGNVVVATAPTGPAIVLAPAITPAPVTSVAPVVMAAEEAAPAPIKLTPPAESPAPAKPAVP